MVITTRTHTTLFANNTTTVTSTSTARGLIRLPLSVVPHYETRCETTGAIIPAPDKALFRPNLWSSDEHERFLHGLELFPNGPWKEVAKVVGTKTTRQTMTHAQKYRQKIERRMQMQAKPQRQKSKSKVLVSSDVNRTPHRMSYSPNHVQSVSSKACFMEELRSCNFEVSTTTYPMSSPTKCFLDAFDTSFLDHDLDALLSNLTSSTEVVV